MRKHPKCENGTKDSNDYVDGGNEDNEENEDDDDNDDEKKFDDHDDDDGDGVEVFWVSPPVEGREGQEATTSQPTCQHRIGSSSSSS